MQRVYAWHDIPHYYGDYVRVLFIAVAVLSAVAVPVFGDLLPFGTLAQVLAALLLVLLAGLTHPHSAMLSLYNSVVSAIGVILLQSAALLLLFAFYFSLKTLRAFGQGKLGKVERPWEFEDSKD